jgi:hypothetical protein
MRNIILCCLLALIACGGRSAADDVHGVVWSAGDAKLGKWKIATSLQCGTPVNFGKRFVFTLAYTVVDGAGTCMRNQVNPLDAQGDTFYLKDGVKYTWSFRFIDGTPYVANSMRMGPDHDARSLIWQIHGNIERGTPCTTLSFTNGPDNVTYDNQQWGFSTCNGVVWHGRYVPGETDDWKIVAIISKGDDGMTQLYRNGVLQITDRGANYHDSHISPGNPNGFPWWNFGPYKWIWKDAPTNSSMTSVNMTIDNMVLTQG